MPVDRLKTEIIRKLDEIRRAGTAKGHENVITRVVPPRDGNGPRFVLRGRAGMEFIRMNSNDYLGLSLDRALREAEEYAVESHAVGPGAVRFISGTWDDHTALEVRLAQFHNRQQAMLFSSAYATVMGVLPSLIDESTAVLSDELNHNCIINAIKLAEPAEKYIYPHLDLKFLEKSLEQASSSCRRAIIVTDGVFSMRGDYAPLAQIVELAERWDAHFDGNVIVVVDDSHGVGAYGVTGRGTEEVCASRPVDVLISTLGKAVGVNGGYVVADGEIVDYLREVSPFYIYSNPIGPGEAAAALAGVNVIDSEFGRDRLKSLQELSDFFRNQLTRLGFETIETRHPIVAIILRDTTKTRAMVDYLDSHGVLATGLTHPVVPSGQDEIRLQVSAAHTRRDIDQVLRIFEEIKEL